MAIIQEEPASKKDNSCEPMPSANMENYKLQHNNFDSVCRTDYQQH